MGLGWGGCAAGWTAIICVVWGNVDTVGKSGSVGIQLGHQSICVAIGMIGEWQGVGSVHLKCPKPTNWKITRGTKTNVILRINCPCKKTHLRSPQRPVACSTQIKTLILSSGRYIKEGMERNCAPTQFCFGLVVSTSPKSGRHFLAPAFVLASAPNREKTHAPVLKWATRGWRKGSFESRRPVVENQTTRPSKTTCKRFPPKIGQNFSFASIKEEERGKKSGVPPPCSHAN